MIEINDDLMVLRAADGTRLEARYSEDAAADGGGAWVIGATPYAARLFSRNQAITALSIEGRLRAGHDDTDPNIRSWKAELGL